MRILNVDDNPDNLYFLETLFQGHGHQVVNARSGVEGLRALEQGDEFDIVISDILMPEMDGFQFCRQIKNDERFRHIPFIMYTATYTSRQDEQFGLALGAARFVVKPKEPDELLEILQAVHLEGDRATVPKPAPTDGDDYFRVYNQRLVNKLERKVEQLEATSKALQQSQEELSLVWKNSVDGMLLTDGENRILRVNSAFAEMCGKSTEQLQGIAAATLGLPDAPVEVPCRIDVQLSRSDGVELVAEAIRTPFASADGKPLVFGLFRDVTARRQSERERSALETQLAEARKMESVGRLAAGIAHDFNNLLTVINGYCGLMRNTLPSEGRAPVMLTQIQNASKRATELTRQLLTLSRGQKSPDSPVDLNILVHECLPMLQRLAGPDVHITTDLDGGLGPVLGDSGQFLQVIMNLTANARDAMPNGGALFIRTSKGNGNNVCLAITDTGTGIPPDILPNIFDPFFTTKANEGTGLGLFTVAGIVQRVGGNIAVRNGYPSGASFEITLPQVDASPLAADSGSTYWEEPPPPEAFLGTVLVVEDRADVRELVASMLEDGGYGVLTAGSGLEALEISRTAAGPLDVLLTDVKMSGMSGLELAERARTTRPGLAVVLMSGAFGDIEGGTPAALKIMKPFSEQELVDKVREAMRISQNTPR